MVAGPPGNGTRPFPCTAPRTKLPVLDSLSLTTVLGGWRQSWPVLLGLISPLWNGFSQNGQNPWWFWKWNRTWWCRRSRSCSHRRCSQGPSYAPGRPSRSPLPGGSRKWALHHDHCPRRALQLLLSQHKEAVEGGRGEECEGNWGEEVLRMHRDALCHQYRPLTAMPAPHTGALISPVSSTLHHSRPFQKLDPLPHCSVLPHSARGRYRA